MAEGKKKAILNSWAGIPVLGAISTGLNRALGRQEPVNLRGLEPGKKKDKESIFKRARKTLFGTKKSTSDAVQATQTQRKRASTRVAADSQTTEQNVAESEIGQVDQPENPDASNENNAQRVEENKEEREKLIEARRQQRLKRHEQGGRKAVKEAEGLSHEEPEDLYPDFDMVVSHDDTPISSFYVSRFEGQFKVVDFAQSATAQSGATTLTTNATIEFNNPEDAAKFVASLNNEDFRFGVEGGTKVTVLSKQDPDSEGYKEALYITQEPNSPQQSIEIHSFKNQAALDSARAEMRESVSQPAEIQEMHVDAARAAAEKELEEELAQSPFEEVLEGQIDRPSPDEHAETKKAANEKLHMAVLSGNVDEVIDHVINLSAEEHLSESPNTKNNSGQTPLHLAVEAGNLAMVEALLDVAADPRIQNDNNESAFDRAKSLSEVEQSSEKKEVYNKIANMLSDRVNSFEGKEEEIIQSSVSAVSKKPPEAVNKQAPVPNPVLKAERDMLKDKPKPASLREKSDKRMAERAESSKPEVVSEASGSSLGAEVNKKEPIDVSKFHIGTKEEKPAVDKKKTISEKELGKKMDPPQPPKRASTAKGKENAKPVSKASSHNGGPAPKWVKKTETKEPEVKMGSGPPNKPLPPNPGRR